MICPKCTKDYKDGDFSTVNNEKMCEDCAIESGLFPLEHTVPEEIRYPNEEGT